MRAIKQHRLAPKSVLDRRKTPLKKVALTPPPAEETAFRRRLPVQSQFKGIPRNPPTDKKTAFPISSPTTYLTLHDFPSMRPVNLCQYPSTFLRSPMRRDILHRAVVHEANDARGTGGHTKTRGEVRGSTRKIFQQKGTGMARAGARLSPIRRGGYYLSQPLLI